MKRFLCFLLGAALFAVSVLPVTALAAESSNLTELLEYSTVNNQGHNRFTFTDSTTVILDVPMYTTLRFVDMIIQTDDAVTPGVAISYAGKLTQLTVKQVTSGLYRAYGSISGVFEDLYIKFTASGSRAYVLKSCKVSSVTTSRTAATATFDANVDGDWHYNIGIGTPLEIDGTGEPPAKGRYQGQIMVTDATKFDKIYINFASNYASINSIRCTYGSTTVPYTWYFMDPEANGSGFYYYDNIHEGLSINTFGRVIAGIEVDLSQIDRSKNQYLVLYFNGDWNYSVGLYLNCSGVEGEVLFADTQNATWWDRITAFFTDLFGGDSSDAEDFGSSMETQAGQMQDAVDEMDDVTKPNVDDLDISLDEFMGDEGMAPVNDVLGSFFSNDIIVTMLIICLTCAFASYALFGKR